MITLSNKNKNNNFKEELKMKIVKVNSSVNLEVTCKHPDTSPKFYDFMAYVDGNDWSMDYKQIRKEVEQVVNKNGYWHEIEIIAKHIVGDEIFTKNISNKEGKEMEKKWVVFENYHIEEEQETVIFYFKCNNEVLKEFGVLDDDSLGGRISLEFPWNCIEPKECSTEISPMDENDECYNWTDALVDYTECETLLNLIPKPMYDLAIVEIEEKEMM